jgi:outer membrane lipoprotein LolB
MQLQMITMPTVLRHYGAALGLALSLTGCAGLMSQPQQNAGPPVARHYQETIALGGRMSIRYTQNNLEQAVHGSFTWDQQTRHIVLSLLSPLGQTLATIDIRPGMAVLTQSDKVPLAATDVDILTEQALGWPLPVAGLRDWLQGFGSSQDGQPFVAQPAQAPQRVLTPDGWTLTYGEWQDDAANTAQNRPKRIDLTRDTRQAGPVSIRIVIDKWQASGNTAGKS